MKREIIDVYKELIHNFINETLPQMDKAILFFQGFSGDFYKALAESEIKHFSNANVIPSSEYINYNTIESDNILQCFLNCQGICWGYYEELQSLLDILHDVTIFKVEIIVIHNNFFSVYFPIDVPIEISEAALIFENESPIVDNKNLIKFYSDFKLIDRTGFYSYVNKHYEIDTDKKITEIDFYKSVKQKNIDIYATNPVLINIQDLDIIKNKLQLGELSDCIFNIQSLSEERLEKEIFILNNLGSHFKIAFKLINISRQIDLTIANQHLQLFRKYWGHSAEFRNIPIYKDPATDTETVNVSQGLLVSNIISQCESALSHNNYSDIIITAPTGAGKSLFFQLPAIFLHKEYKALTLVITPLIALMNDQINELQEKGIDFATFINSEISYEQRQEIIEGILGGKYSIVYLSPELLLSTDIRRIIGDRKIGLVVVDEAHLVTSWGRDFRVDYWFLGDYLEKIRRGSYYKERTDALRFPILCLTATAVFGGRDDVVGDLQNSLYLNCSAEHLYIGYVKRDNISFDIHKNISKARNSKKEDKISITSQSIKRFIDSKQKSIVYFPYVSQIEDVYGYISDQYPMLKSFVERYSGSGMDKFEKNEAYIKFRESALSMMLATKAFGMGVNIPDVSVVYHYAPTGTLADYVQEIGRAARTLDHGYAVTDYLYNDMHYAKVLWGLSGLRHYQIKAIIKKLYDLYLTKKSRHLLFSSDVFSYLFGADSIDNKVKSGLMLISTDLLEKYHFRVINVRPKNIFSVNFINVPSDVEKEFMSMYGKYCVLMQDDKPRTIPAHGYANECTIYNSGKIYEIDLSKCWENEFNDLTFAKFKHHFFNGDLFPFDKNKIVARTKLIIHFEHGYDKAKEELLIIASAIQKTFKQIYKDYGGRDFSFDDFRKLFISYYDKKERKEYVQILLDLFCYEEVYFEDVPTEHWKFIYRRKDSNSTGEYAANKYCIRTVKHSLIEQNIKRYIKQCLPNSNDGKSFTAYLPIPKRNEKYSEYQLIASLLELFNLATYELVGGKNPQIFVRINDPLKLKRIAESKNEYRNSLLTTIEDRHKRAAEIVDKFMSVTLSDSDRWSLIENYFLGNDGLVDAQLGIEK